MKSERKGGRFAATVPAPLDRNRGFPKGKLYKAQPLVSVKSHVSLTVVRSKCGLFYGDVQHAWRRSRVLLARRMGRAAESGTPAVFPNHGVRL